MNSNTKIIKPVFLLGAGRSGTKFLRDIISTSDKVSAIPYDVGYVWRYGNNDCPHDEFTPNMLDDSIKQYIKKTLPKLSIGNSSQSLPTIFIEKSVPNTLRPAFLHAVYPDAKFIHLIRDGREVTESALRLWRTPPEKSYLLKKLRYFPWENYRYAIWYITNIIKGKLSSDRGQQTWGPRYNGIDDDVKRLPLEVVCARQWRKCVEISLSQLSSVNKNNVLEVRYEDLMTDSKSISSICEFLAIDDTNKVVSEYETRVIRSNMNKWKNSLTREQLRLINNEIQDLNIELGYA